MPVPHEFDQSRVAGDRWEAWIAEWLPGAKRGARYEGVRSGGRDDRAGTDGREYRRVQVKGDEQAHCYLNGFVETHSVLEDGTLGWAAKAETDTWDVLYYVIPGLGLILEFDSATIQYSIADWATRYPEKDVANRGRGGRRYTTRGIAVPLAEFADAAHATHWCPELQAEWRERERNQPPDP